MYLILNLLQKIFVLFLYIIIDPVVMGSSKLLIEVHPVMEDTHRFNTLPGIPNASVLVNGCNFTAVPGVDIYYETGSYTFE